MSKIKQLQLINQNLRNKLQHAQDALQAIQKGSVDGVIVSNGKGTELYSRENTTINKILESISDAFVSIDKDWRFTYINKQGEQLFHIKRDTILNKKFSKIFGRSKNSEIYKKALHTLKSHTSTLLECYYASIKKWLRINIYPSDGGLTFFFNDITDRKEMEEKVKQSEQRFRLLVESAKEFAIMMLDTKGNVISWNKGAENLLGYTEKEILGQNFSIFFTAEDKTAGLPKRELARVLETGKSNDDNWLLRKDHTKFWASGMTMCVYDDNKKLQGLAKIARDITVRKQLEKQKDEFMSIASHELKTPVTSIKAYTQVLQTIFKKKEDNNAVNYLGKMDAQLNKLTDLIGDLLDVTKIEAGKLLFNIHQFSFDELVSEIVESMQLTTTKHTLIIRGKTNKKILSDRDRIEQVLTNLLTNAIKYSPNSEKILVELSSRQSTIKVCVQDFGLGISKDKQTNLFQRFYRVSGPDNSTFPGLGLGLYISAQIIKRMGGKIWVNSKEHQGSQFCFSIPTSISKN